MTELDNALTLTKEDESKEDSFYSLFLNSNLLIPTYDEPISSNLPHRIVEGEHFIPCVIEHDGTSYLPIFDTMDRLTNWAAGQKITYVQMAGHSLICSFSDPTLHVLLNAGTSYGKVFTPSELDWLRNCSGKIYQKEFQVPTGTKVIIEKPLKIPEGLEDSLRLCLKRNQEVSTAYLGQIHFLIDGEKPQLFLVLKIDDSGQSFISSIQNDIGVAVQRFTNKDNPITLQIYDGKGISSDIVENIEPFYKRK